MKSLDGTVETLGLAWRPSLIKICRLIDSRRAVSASWRSVSLAESGGGWQEGHCLRDRGRTFTGSPFSVSSVVWTWTKLVSRPLDSNCTFELSLNFRVVFILSLSTGKTGELQSTTGEGNGVCPSDGCLSDALVLPSPRPDTLDRLWELSEWLNNRFSGGCWLLFVNCLVEITPLRGAAEDAGDPGPGPGPMLPPLTVTVIKAKIGHKTSTHALMNALDTAVDWSTRCHFIVSDTYLTTCRGHSLTGLLVKKKLQSPSFIFKLICIQR